MLLPQSATIIPSNSKLHRKLITPRTHCIPMRSRRTNNEFKAFLYQILQDFSICDTIFVRSQSERLTSFQCWDQHAVMALYDLWLLDNDKYCCIWIIYLEDDPKNPIGLVSCSQRPNTDSNCRFLDVIIHPSYRGQGFGTEAAKAVTKDIFFPSSTGPFMEHIITGIKSPIEKVFSIAEESEEGEAWKRVLEKLGLKSHNQIVCYSKKCDVFCISKQHFESLWIYDAEDYY